MLNQCEIFTHKCNAYFVKKMSNLIAVAFYLRHQIIMKHHLKQCMVDIWQLFEFYSLIMTNTIKVTTEACIQLLEQQKLLSNSI